MLVSTIQDLNFITGSVGATLGFAVGIILLTANKEQSLSTKLLSGLIFCLSLFSLSYALVGTQFFIKYPHAWRFSAPFSGITPPLIYIYVRSVLYQEFRLRSFDSLLFIPGFLLFIDFLPFYLLSVEEKRAIVKNLFNNTKLGLVEIDGMFPPGVGMIIRSTTGLVFTSLAIFETFKFKKMSSFKKMNQEKHNHEVYNWLNFLLASVLLSYLLLVLWNFLGITAKIEFFVAIGFTTAGLIFAICMYLFLQPGILYGLHGWYSSPIVSPILSSPQEKGINGFLQDDAVSSFSPEMRVEMRNTLENHFKNNKSFASSGYKIKDLSSELNIPVNLISSFINQEYGTNFNGFINDHRVEYISNLLQESPDSQSFTLEAVAKSAGFNSRNTFISAVKKKYGKTPSAHFNRKLT